MVFHTVDLFHNFDSVSGVQFLMHYFDVANSSPSQKLPKLSEIIPYLVIKRFYWYLEADKLFLKL